MNGIFQPLFGESPKDDSSKAHEQMKDLGQKEKNIFKTSTKHKNVISTPISTPSPAITTTPAIQNKLKSTKSQLEGFVSDNKNTIIIVIFIIILLVLAYLIYKQKKQAKSMAIMKKKLLRMK